MITYKAVKQQLSQGWNTWNTRSVLSHVYLPAGLALNLAFKEYARGRYLKEALIGRMGDDVERIHPGDHAYDGRYTQLTLTWHGMEVCVESALDDEDLVLLVTPSQLPVYPPTLVLEAGMLWNRPGTLALDGEAITAVLPDKQVRVFCTAPLRIEPNIPVQTPYLAVSLEGAVGFSTGKTRTLEEIQQLCAKQKEHHASGFKQYGDLTEVYHAMQTCMAWDTIYEPKKDRVVTPVSRLWNINWGGYVLFCWDTYFAAQMAAVDNKELAVANAVEITREKTPDGFVPNFGSDENRQSFDRSQPPVGSMAVREIYRKYQETWLLEELFDDLYTWNSWYYDKRRTAEGCLAWGSKQIPVVYGSVWETAGVNDTFGGALESGLDNSPMYDDIPFNKETDMMELADVGLTGLYLMDCYALADIAKVLGRTAELAVLQQRAEQCEKGLQTLWDEQFGFFLNKRTDTGQFSRRISPTNFYAFFSRNLTEGQKEAMLKHFYNPEEFWGEWIIPSIARNDPAYGDQNYWRGRIWAPMNFLVYLGLRQQGLTQACSDLAVKSKELLLKEWLEQGHVHENYNGDTGEGCDARNSDRFYHWGALLALIALIEDGYVPAPMESL